MNIKINPIISVLAIIFAVVIFAIVVFMFAKDAYAPTQTQQPMPGKGIPVGHNDDSANFRAPKENITLAQCQELGGEAIEVDSEKKECPDGRINLGMVNDANRTYVCCRNIPDHFDSSNGARQDDDQQDDVFCTMEAKQCPDGSFVGRTGPNCEFAPCPGQ